MKHVRSFGVAFQVFFVPMLTNPVDAREMGSRRLDGAEFLSRCTDQKQRLFEVHQRAVKHSIHRWERQQMREKTLHRAIWLATLSAENESRMNDLQDGAKAYNLKSIRQAAVQGDTDRLTELLNQGFNADSPSAMGLTPLLGACQSGCFDAVQILLHFGASIDQQHVKTKRTALMEASARQNPEVVRVLLRHGANLHLRDAHGENALDCASHPQVRALVESAMSIWSPENADVFPHSFRATANTLLLIQRYQETEQREKRVATRRYLTSLRSGFARAAAEAKMRYDEHLRAGHNQVTLLQKVDSLTHADRFFDNELAELMRSVEQALLLQVEAGRLRVLPTSAIFAILVFCGRHWFEINAADEQDQRPRPRQVQPKVGCIRGKKTSLPLHSLPESLEGEWESVQTMLSERCDLLRCIQAEERTDIENGVMRRSDGTTVATLQIQLLEARHLPFRDIRMLEPIDPCVRMTLRDGANTFASSTSDIRLGNRHPVWFSEFTFSVETVRSDLLVEVVDAKRREVCGEVTVPLRLLLDQKEHDEWLELPPTLKQQVLEKAPRECAACLHVGLRLVHTKAILLTREIQQILTKRAEVLRKKREHTKRVFEDCLQKLGSD